VAADRWVGTTGSRVRRRTQDLTQSGEEPGSYAGPPGSRARRQERWSRRTEGITSNDDSVTPTGVMELEPDPLGEAQGSGTEGVPNGLSAGDSPSTDDVVRCCPAAVAEPSPLVSEVTVWRSEKRPANEFPDAFGEGRNE
jgi:hypothetical protein